jgi:hypothetical protein
MSESLVTPRLQALLDGLSRPEEPQAREGKPGDPQLAALCQFLIQNEVDSSHVLADFGSGNGVLAEYLARVWPPSVPLPEYWGVDLPDALNSLSLPSRIHNNSKKYTVEEFYEVALPQNADRISIVVIRNTLHEMDIEATARLFRAMRQHVMFETVVYIQDMARLTKPERRNVAWTKDLLHACLEEYGFEVSGGLKLPSHGGTPWFAMLCRSRQGEPIPRGVDGVARHRLKQFHEIAEQLNDIGVGFDNVDELLTLQQEFGSLGVQLRNTNWLPTAPNHEPTLEKLGIPTRTPSKEQLEYACAAGDSIAGKSGLIAMISNKRLLDFPTLIRSAKKQLAFGGYSNRPLFLHEANVQALIEAIASGTRVRVMLVDPHCSVAQLRAEEPIYSAPEAFLYDIQQTINGGKSFFEHLCGSIDRSIALSRFQLRSSKRVPRWSYFIIDDTCYLSFYSIVLTGSSAPCFVFRALPHVANNYFYAVQKEFSHVFEEATDLLVERLE